MGDEDAHSVIIDIPKLRVFTHKSIIVTKTKDIKRTPPKSIRKPSEVSLRKYSLPGNNLLEINKFKKADFLLPYKLYSKKQDKIRHKQRLAINIYDKYKIANIDLRKRLYVEEPADDVRTVTEVNEDYFQHVNGRPLVNTIPLFKSLNFLLSNQLRTRQEVGYRYDGILNIEANHRKEIERYDRTVKRYMEQVKNFDKFISVDYRNSMACLQKWDILSKEVQAKIMELENLAVEKFTTVSRLIGLDYLYSVQQKYGRFLYYLSPPSWRSRNREFARSIEIEAKGFDLGTSSEEDTFNVVFEKMQKECFGGLVKPVLYFTHPNNLLEIFDGIEKQQLHHFTHVTHLAPHTKTLREGIKHLKDIIAQDSAIVNHTIKRFEKLLAFSEERMTQLQAKFFKILNGQFYESVGAADVLKLQLHLEFCYEKVYTEKPLNMDMFTTAKALERFYMDYSKQLEAVHSEKVKLAMKQCLESERRKVKRAKIAARELRLFNNLERALLRAYAPTPAIELPPTVKRTTKPKVKRLDSKPNVKGSNVHVLTEAEHEYLTLFTDWSNNEDPAKYLQSISVTIEEDSGNIFGQTLKRKTNGY